MYYTYLVNFRLERDSNYVERWSALDTTINNASVGPIRDELTSVYLFNSSIGISQIEAGLVLAVDQRKDSVDILNITTREVRSFGPLGDKSKLSNILLRGAGSTLAKLAAMPTRNALTGLPPRKSPF